MIGRFVQSLVGAMTIALEPQAVAWGEREAGGSEHEELETYWLELRVPEP